METIKVLTSILLYGKINTIMDLTSVVTREGRMSTGTTKAKRTYNLEPRTVSTIERLARETRRGKSVIVDLAVEAYAELEDGIVQLRREREEKEAQQKAFIAKRHESRRPDSGDLARAETVDLVEAAAG
jgi:high-affinity K+ transport system ATPase subunit B